MAKRPRIYIAGPITGTDDYIERFAAAEAKLQKEGNLVVNPTAFSAHLLNAEFDWAEFMSVTLTLMKTCDKVIKFICFPAGRTAKAVAGK